MGSKEVIILGSTQCSKKLNVDLISMTPSPKGKFKKKNDRTNGLINMNHTINTHTHTHTLEWE
jgi:hypothetical protein